jgi:hypothetical protein
VRPSAVSWSPTPAAPQAEAPATRSTALPAETPAGLATEVDDEVPVPQWQTLLKAMAPAPTPEPEVEQTDPTGALIGGAVPGEDAELEQPERIRRPLPFTWLQWIVLAVVAFVLGFLIIFVANTTSNDAAGPEVPALAAATPAAPAPPVL